MEFVRQFLEFNERSNRRYVEGWLLPDKTPRDGFSLESAISLDYDLMRRRIDIFRPWRADIDRIRR